MELNRSNHRLKNDITNQIDPKENIMNTKNSKFHRAITIYLLAFTVLFVGVGAFLLGEVAAHTLSSVSTGSI